MYGLMAQILKHLKSARAIKYVVWFHEAGVNVSVLHRVISWPVPE